MLEEQWNAIINCDSSYDGQFFYAVRTTGIFCRPSCKSRDPNRDNVLVFMTVDAAMEAGFRTCKRCRPDKFRWPAEELVHKTKEYIEEHYSEPLTLGGIAKALHISQYHLHHVFKRLTGLTPVEYLLQTRLAEANRLLEETNLNVTEVAVSVGFVSVAHFSTVFRKQLGQSPSAHRSLIRVSETDVSELKRGYK
ncbi:MAG: bifunctional transcriptional activator/DNA repair enzyme AdaA [Bacilli bacterium]